MMRCYLFTKFYDLLLSGMEKKSLAGLRKDLLSKVKGEVLEIGSGTGVNLNYYSNKVDRLVLLEPDNHMRKLLLNKLSQNELKEYMVIEYGAEKIKCPDDFFDCAVSTLTLCSVNNPEKVLTEVCRVLKPGGKLFFIEHVVDPDNMKIYKRQKFYKSIWKFAFCNCHIDRNTEKTILDAGLKFIEFKKVYIKGGPSVVSPVIVGIAEKFV